MIVHDLKSPLAAMMLAGESILGEPLADRPRAAAQNILDGAHVIHRMVMDILDVDRCEDGALQLRLEEVELRALLAACVESARAQARAAGLELALEADGPLGVVADPELVRRVIANLVDNAIQYAPTGSAIRLVAAPGAGERVAIRVHDRGPGVPAAERARVFEPYARIERGAVRAARSSHGLGLAFCKLAVEAHRGRIWIEDDQPAGSVFCVELPCRPTAP
jgi:signal transduction histidine kinase